MEQLTQVLLNGAISILVIIIGAVVEKFRKWLEAKTGLAGIRVVEIVASNVVSAVEQITKDKNVKGKDKYEMAERMAIDILQSYGVKVSLKELRAVLEASVKAMNDGWSGKMLPIETGVVELENSTNEEHEVIVEE
ncbi:phage holin family protein [Aerococcaceae bacterium NML160702]|nr:phage holin family protein [Aerococcaceae bacterium NML190073]MCW6681549.1 phage holin family protein [Aerococcaceae bacterium NML160702]